jgi:hypothetical protein
LTDAIITNAIIEAYREEGAVLVPGAFRDWVPRLLAAHDALQNDLEHIATTLDSGVRMAQMAGDPQSPPLGYTHQANGAFGIRNAVFHNQTFRAWQSDPRTAEIIARAIGSSTIRFWWDQSFCKDSQNPAGATPWHTDAGSFSFAGQHLPSVWIAGTTITVDAAPLLTLAGSHRDARWFRPVFGRDDVKVLPENYAELDVVRDAVEANPDKIRTWTCEAGDLILIHPHTYHASLPLNGGVGRRIAFTSRWLGDDIVWNRREMTFDYPDDPRFHNIAQGKPPPDDGFPVLWRA